MKRKVYISSRISRSFGFVCCPPPFCLDLPVLGEAAASRRTEKLQAEVSEQSFAAGKGHDRYVKKMIKPTLPHLLPSFLSSHSNIRPTTPRYYSNYHTDPAH